MLQLISIIEHRPQSRDPSLEVPAQVLHRPYIKICGERWEDQRPKEQPRARCLTSTTFPSLPTSIASSVQSPVLAHGDEFAPTTRISAEEAVRLPQVHGSIEDEAACPHWKRMRGGVHVEVQALHRQAAGVSVHAAARRGLLNVMEFLIREDGVPVDTLDKERMTALHHASKGGSMSAVALLLSLSANVNMQSATGWTSLALAADKGHVDVCKLLIRSNARVDLHSQHNVSPLHRAAQRGHEELVNLLVRNGTFTYFYPCTLRETPHSLVLTHDTITHTGADYREQDELMGYSAVHHAASCGRSAILLFFVGECRQHLDDVNKWGQTV
jgi:hypothetical protein